jgi:hypothetical protein
MKNELLLASILLGNPVSAMTELNLNDVITISKQYNEENIIGVFKSTKIYPGYRWIEENDEWVKHQIKETIQMSLEKVQYQPSYWDEDLNDYVEVEMDYTLHLTRTNIADETDTQGTDTSFYVKKIEKNLYRLWDCDSSANCQSNAYLEFAIYDSPNGRVFKVKKPWTGRKHESWELNIFKKNDVLLEVK